MKLWSRRRRGIGNGGERWRNLVKNKNMVTVNNGIVGTFVFRNEGDGCLNAKYMNEDERLPYGETCVLTIRLPEHEGFVGQYKTVWFERNGQHVAANLSIDFAVDESASNAITFNLRWTGDSNQLLFKGIGMRYGDLLIGSYWEDAQ